MNLSLIDAYKNLLKSVPEIIKASGYRNDYIASKMGLKTQNFAIKKMRQSWTPDELDKLISVVHNEDVEDFILGIIMQSRAAEESVSLEEYRKK